MSTAVSVNGAQCRSAPSIGVASPVLKEIRTGYKNGGKAGEPATARASGNLRAKVAPPSIAMNDVFQAALPYVWFGLLVLAAAFFFPPLATWLPGLLGNCRPAIAPRGEQCQNQRKSPGGWMNTTRWSVFATALAAGVACSGGISAQDWPTRPVTMVVPYAPGGPIDQAARVIGRELSEKLGQQFIVEHRGGAGGAVGAAQVAKSKPDGYTLLVTANGPAVLNKMLYASLPYDPEADFAPISLVSDVPMMFMVKPSSPVQDLKDFVAQAKQKREAVTIGHPGIGTAAHLAALWFASSAAINIVPVAYRGTAPIVTAVLGGEIELGLASYVPQVQSVKTIAVTAEQRVDFLPGAPTARESGVLDIVTGTFTALVAPAGVPPEIASRMNRILDVFLKTEEAKKQFAALGAQVLGGAPGRVIERMNQERALWGPIVKRENIQLQ